MKLMPFVWSHRGTRTSSDDPFSIYYCLKQKGGFSKNTMKTVPFISLIENLAVLKALSTTQFYSFVR